MCPDRHQINLQIDMLQNMPSKITQTSGLVTVSYCYLSWFWVLRRQVLNRYLSILHIFNIYINTAVICVLYLKNVCWCLAFFFSPLKGLQHKYELCQICP